MWRPPPVVGGDSAHTYTHACMRGRSPATHHLAQYFTPEGTAATTCTK